MWPQISALLMEGDDLIIAGPLAETAGKGDKRYERGWLWVSIVPRDPDPEHPLEPIAGSIAWSDERNRGEAGTWTHEVRHDDVDQVPATTTRPGLFVPEVTNTAWAIRIVAAKYPVGTEAVVTASFSQLAGDPLKQIDPDSSPTKYVAYTYTWSDDVKVVRYPDIPHPPHPA